MRRVWTIALVIAVSSSCAPRACDDRDDRIARDVELLLGDSKPAADAAHERLVAYGRPAIVMLESGLYQAEPPGRRRIVRALVAIGNPEAIPILRHLAEHDADEAVRAEAKRGLTALGAP